MMMSAVLAAMLLSLCAAVIALLLIWGNRWVRGVALVLLCVWGYHAQWWTRFAIDARWVDDARSRYQQDAVIAAIKAGRTTIPLAETTNFAWTAVCRVWAQPPFSPAWDAELRRKVFGTSFIPYFAFGGGGEHYVLVYATPKGPYIIQPFWEGRFQREFQRWPAGRYYAEQLNHTGYYFEEGFRETRNNPWNNICFKPENVWLEIFSQAPWLKK
jgi:hypothetical protein